MHEQASRSSVDDLGRPVPSLAHTAVAEDDWLAVPQVDAVLLLLPDEVEGAVVVDVAVLEDLDERRTAVRGRGPEDATPP